MPTTMKIFNPTSDDKKDLKDIHQAYLEYLEDLRKRNKIKKEDADEWKKKADGGVLTFGTPEEAKAFFKGQAETGKEFIAPEVDSSGKYLGNYFISDGDGKLYEGKLPPATLENLNKHWGKLLNDPALKKETYDALKNSDADAINALIARANTHSMKAAVSEQRDTSPAPAAGLTGAPKPALMPAPDSPEGRRKDDEERDDHGARL